MTTEGGRIFQKTGLRISLISNLLWRRKLSTLTPSLSSFHDILRLAFEVFSWSHGNVARCRQVEVEVEGVDMDNGHELSDFHGLWFLISIWSFVTGLELAVVLGVFSLPFMIKTLDHLVCIFSSPQSWKYVGLCVSNYNYILTNFKYYYHCGVGKNKV